MNKKGFVNIILISLVVILAGALGYVTLVKKPALTEQPQTNNLPNTQSTTPSPTNTTNSQNPPTNIQIPVKPSPSTSSPGPSTVTLIFPNGGERLVKGKTFKITWKMSASFNSGYPQVSINLITSKGKQAVTPNQQIITNNTGNFEWVIPTTQLSGYVQDYSGGSYTLRALDDQSEFQFLIEGYPHTTGRAEGPFDYSDGSFYIVKSPTPTTQTPSKNVFINNPYSLEFTLPSDYFVASNQYGVTDATKAEAFYFRKEPNNYNEIPVLDVSTNLEPSSGQNLNQFAQSIYLLNKDKNQVTTDLKQTSYGGTIAYEFGLQTAFNQPDGGRLLDFPGAKVVFLQHGGKTFKFLQTGDDSGLTSILNSLKFK